MFVKRIAYDIIQNGYQDFVKSYGNSSAKSLWLGAVRQQAITWANVDPNLCHQIASLYHNALTGMGWKLVDGDGDGGRCNLPKTDSHLMK